ncbi:MAG: hypothetical protein IJM23_05720 [Lachnospiraceae bacterium]|nr:hypothetical protein [Lachnospiraceae bacterium]
MKKDNYIRLRISSELKKELKKESQKKGLTMSQYIMTCITGMEYIYNEWNIIPILVQLTQLISSYEESEINEKELKEGVASLWNSFPKIGFGTDEKWKRCKYD